jgi:short-subunit dehydrogenase
LSSTNSKKRLIVFGATSRIVHETLKAMPLDKMECLLVARNPSELDGIKQDLIARFPEATISARTCDFSDPDQINIVWSEVDSSEHKPVDIVYLGFGSMEAEDLLRTNRKAREQFLSTNVTGVLDILCRTRQIFLKQGQGTLCVVTSVAGDKGRSSNYIYGSAKSLVSKVLEGMWHEFAGTEIKVIDIRPGITESPMTAHLKKGPLMSPASTVGLIIAKSILRGGPRVVYAPGFWAWIMLVVRFLPDVIFKKTKF